MPYTFYWGHKPPQAPSFICLFDNFAHSSSLLQTYVLSWKGNIFLLSFAVLRSEFIWAKSEARMQAGWKSSSQYIKTRAFSTLRQVSDKYHPFLTELPHPTLIQTLHSVCLASAEFIALFSRNKITISAWKSEQIFFPPKGIALALSAHCAAQCQPSANEPRGGNSWHREETSGCWEAAGRRSKPDGWKLLLLHQGQTRDSHPVVTQLQSHGNFLPHWGWAGAVMSMWQTPQCAGRWDTWSCCPCLQRHSPPGRTSTRLRGPSCCLCFKSAATLQPKPAPSGWAAIT